jgi:hypothetical protein
MVDIGNSQPHTNLPLLAFTRFKGPSRFEGALATGVDVPNPSIEITRALPHLYVRMIEKNKQMTSPDVLLALVRCELKARYNGWVAGSYAAF